MNPAQLYRRQDRTISVRSLAAHFAGRLLEVQTARERVDTAWRLTAGRAPNADERARALKFLSENPDDPAKVKEFALAMFNLNAFLYVN